MKPYALIPLAPAPHPFKLTVSIGVSSTSSQFYSDWREMLKDADQALYVAKNSGKDRIEICAPEKKTSSILASDSPITFMSRSTHIRAALVLGAVMASQLFVVGNSRGHSAGRPKPPTSENNQRGKEPCQSIQLRPPSARKKPTGRGVRRHRFDRHTDDGNSDRQRLIDSQVQEQCPTRTTQTGKRKGRKSGQTESRVLKPSLPRITHPAGGDYRVHRMHHGWLVR